MRRLQSLKRLWPYVRRHRRMYVEGTVLTVVSTGFAAVGPLLIRYAIHGLETGGSWAAVRLAGAALIGFAVLRAFLLFRGRFRLIAASRFVERDIRNDLFRRLTRLGVPFFDRTKTGEITSRLINDAENIRQLVGFGLLIVANTTFVFLFGMGAMIWINPWLALLSLVPLALILVVVFVTETRLYRYSAAVQEKLAGLSMYAQENFGGIRVVKGFAEEEGEAARFGQRAQEYADLNIQWAKLRGVASGSITLLAQLILVVTLALGGIGIIRGALNMGDFMAFTAYEMMMIWPAVALGWLLMLLQRGLACLDRVGEFLSEPLEEPSGGAAGAANGRQDDLEKKGSKEVPATAISRASGNHGGLDRPFPIEIRNLTFRYTEGTAPVLDNVSLDVPPGQKIAIVGKIGAGKSSLSALLLGLYEAPPGTVLLGGREVRSLDRHSLRESFACVPQDGFLFSDTIRANLAFGSRRSCRPEAMRRACEIAGIRAEVEELPRRYETVIGERGLTLSGGQRQRMAIARAILHDSRVMILDDAFSSVDSRTEQEILSRLVEFCREKTLILITHRLSSVRDMDKIVVMERGRIVEEGRHPELLSRRGTYKALYDRFIVARELEDPALSRDGLVPDTAPPGLVPDTAPPGLASRSVREGGADPGAAPQAK